MQRQDHRAPETQQQQQGKGPTSTNLQHISPHAKRKCRAPSFFTLCAHASFVPLSISQVPTSAMVPQPALTSDVITPAVELKSSYAGVLAQSLASMPFDAGKVAPQY